MTHFELYRATSIEWRWRLRAKNGEIIASGEGYKTRAAARRAITLVKRTNEGTPVEVFDSEPGAQL